MSPITSATRIERVSSQPARTLSLVPEAAAVQAPQPRRVADTWFVAAMVLSMALFAVTFAKFVVYPAMGTVTASSVQSAETSAH